MDHFFLSPPEFTAQRSGTMLPPLSAVICKTLACLATLACSAALALSAACGASVALDSLGASLVELGGGLETFLGQNERAALIMMMWFPTICDLLAYVF